DVVFVRNVDIDVFDEEIVDFDSRASRALQFPEESDRGEPRRLNGVDRDVADRMAVSVEVPLEGEAGVSRACHGDAPAREVDVVVEDVGLVLESVASGEVVEVIDGGDLIR